MSPKRRVTDNGESVDNLKDVDMLKDYYRSRQIGMRGDCPTCKQTAGINEELIFLLQNIASRDNVGDASDIAKRALVIIGVEPDKD